MVVTTIVNRSGWEFGILQSLEAERDYHRQVRGERSESLNESRTQPKSHAIISQPRSMEWIERNK
jgi:hypothetical protein